MMWEDKETMTNQKWKQREMVRSQERGWGSCLPLSSLMHGTSDGFRGEKRQHQDLSPPFELFSTRTRKSRVEHTKARHGDLPQSQVLAQEAEVLHLTLF